MAISEADLQKVLTETLNPDQATRRAAEKYLTDAISTPDFLLSLLRLAANGSISPPLRQAASVNFKNAIKKGLDPQNEDISIPNADRQTIKDHLVQLMCTVPSQIQAQLSESIALIAQHDYPDNWSNLLPELVQQMGNVSEPSVVVGVLMTADAIFQSFCDVGRSDDLYRTIKYTLEGIQVQLLTLFRAMGQAIDSAPNDKTFLMPRFEALRLMARIFYSLNYQDLPEYFEDHMKEWMQEFAKYLQYTNPVLVDEDEESEPGPIDTLQAAIIRDLSLYADKDEEPFMDYLPQFTKIVWDLLMKTTKLPKHDALATTSIKFLSNLVRKKMHMKLFEDPATLQQFVVSIVIPNLQFRESDQERFEDEPRDFLVTEVEGDDSESRRKCAQDLLKAMCYNFEQQTTALCAEHVGQMLSNYQSNPNQQWAAKDAAINLMMGVAIRLVSRHGVSEVNSNINILDFYQTQILPELQDSNYSDRPVVKATAIKYVAVFRYQFPAQNLVETLPLLIAYLKSPVIVVHTFAAYAIERILSTREKIEVPRSPPRITANMLAPHMEGLFTNLFSIIDNTSQDENDYAMKCTMRALATCGPMILPVTETVVSKLTAALERVSKNPRNPHFNHYLFESMAVVIKSVCSSQASAAASFEAYVFGPCNAILQGGITEFMPYAFQLLAQLLEFHPEGTPLGASYTNLFAPLLSPSLWEDRGSVPALTRLVQAYLDKSPNMVVERVVNVLGIFQYLVSNAPTEASAFDLMSTIVNKVPFETLEPHVPSLLQILLTRLQKRKTQLLFQKRITTFFALFIGKYGVQTLVSRIDGIQNGLMANLLVHVWVPCLEKALPDRVVEGKIQSVGLTKLLCEYPALLADTSGQQLWTKLLHAAVSIMTSTTLKLTSNGMVEAPEDLAEAEITFESKFAQLVYASKPVRDPFAGTDVAASFAQSLSTLSASHPGMIGPLIQQGLGGDAKLSSGLDTLVQRAGVTIM